VAGERLDTGMVADGDDDRLMQAAHRIAEIRRAMTYIDGPGITVPDVDREVRRYLRTGAIEGPPLGLVVVDYLQLAWVRGADMLDQITEVSHTIQGLAKELRITTVGLSQMNRATTAGGGEFKKEGLMGGSPLENDSEQVLLLAPGERTYDGYTLKALALRGKKDTVGESAVLETLASLSAEALGAYTRLIEVNFDGGNWAAVLANAQRGLAINPFNQRIHYCNGCAHEALAEPELAVKSFENALLLDPANPSELRFRLARLLKTDDEAKARRYLLDSLADSPRYREAHGLLLELVEGPKVEAVEPAVPDPVPAPVPAPQ
jgi:tetratricopeptide (TPR) repeat protein